MDLEYVDEYSFSRSLLTPGELIVWKGKPGRGHLMTKRDLKAMPLLLGAFCVFFYELVRKIMTDGNWEQILVRAVPVLILLYLLVGRFLYTAYIRKRTRYVITNQKIIRKRGKSVDVLSCSNLPPMRMNTFKDGYGTIIIGELPQYYTRPNGYGVRIDPNQFTLEAVENAARIRQLILDMEKY